MNEFQKYQHQKEFVKKRHPRLGIPRGAGDERPGRGKRGGTAEAGSGRRISGIKGIPDRFQKKAVRDF